jgi:predicted nucleic acid-binding protein
VDAAALDSWAILALLRRESPADAMMQRWLRRAHAGNLRLLLNLVNLGEVYYRTAQIDGEAAADERLDLMRRLPVEVVPVREALVLEAARLKARHPLAYADAFAVATARLEGVPLITGDPEILGLPKGVVRVRRLTRNARADG